MGKSGGGKKNEKRFKYNSKPQPKSNTNFANKLNDGKKNGYDPNKTVLTDLSARGSTNKLTALQQKFKQKLEGGRFRYINEKLYTNSSGNALTDFQKDPSLFDVVCFLIFIFLALYFFRRFHINLMIMCLCLCVVP